MSGDSGDAVNVCGRAGEYAEGLLSPEEERGFLAHLPTCQKCQQELEEEMQFRSMEERMRSEARRVVPFRVPRRRVVMAGLLAAAAAVLLSVFLRPLPPPPLLATGARRSFEGRVAYGPADRHRPYETMLGTSAPPGDEIPPEVISALARRGDHHGLAAAYLLEGNLARAAQELARAPKSPDLDSDRALLALLARGQAQQEKGLDEALVLLDGVLRAVPDHRQALWNRGLALRDLGLKLAAAGAFEKVAAIDPEWREEARARAAALQGETAELRDAWWSARKLGYEMVGGKAPLPPEVARRFPGTARVLFHDALRMADSRERLDELVPLARELDGSYGGTELQQALDAARRRSFEARRPLLGTYLEIVLGRPPDEAGWRKWLGQARGAGADDLILGALVLTGRAKENLPEVARIVAALRSPWFDMLLAATEIKAKRAAGDGLGSERAISEALGRCDVRKVAFRCMLLETELAELHLEAHRLQAAQTHALKALALARAGNEWGHLWRLTSDLGELERSRSRYPKARAYYEEASFGSSADDCQTRRNSRLDLANVYLLEGRPEDARREAAAASAGACPTPLATPGLVLHLDLFRLGMSVLDEKDLRAQIDALRTRPGVSPSDRLVADFGEARLFIDRDPDAGQKALRSLISGAARLPGDVAAARLGAYAYTMLVVDAARRGAFDTMGALLAEEQGAKSSSARCLVVIARDDLRLAVAVRGPHGETKGAYDERAGIGGSAPLISPQLLGVLAGCPEVQVLAQPPLAGIPRLLPAELAWSYQAAAPDRRPAAAAGASRRLVVTGPTPPPWLELPPLRDWDLPASARGPEVTLLRGPDARPGRVLAEMGDATEIQFHLHAVQDLRQSDAPVLALTPDPDGRWALTAEAVRGASLRRAPLVLLEDCHGGQLAEWIHAAWGLPTAFLAAGAGAVVASPEEVPDSESSRFFGGVGARIRSGMSPAVAVRDERQAWLAQQPDSWVRDVTVFQ